MDEAVPRGRRRDVHAAARVRARECECERTQSCVRARRKVNKFSLFSIPILYLESRGARLSLSFSLPLISRPSFSPLRRTPPSLQPPAASSATRASGAGFETSKRISSRASGREDDDRIPPSVLPRVKLGIIAHYNPVLSSPDASVRASARKREREKKRAEHLLLRDGTRVHPPGAHLSRRSAGETPHE